MKSYKIDYTKKYIYRNRVWCGIIRIIDKYIGQKFDVVFPKILSEVKPKFHFFVYELLPARIGNTCNPSRSYYIDSEGILRDGCFVWEYHLNLNYKKRRKRGQDYARQKRDYQREKRRLKALEKVRSSFILSLDNYVEKEGLSKDYFEDMIAYYDLKIKK